MRSGALNSCIINWVVQSLSRCLLIVACSGTIAGLLDLSAASNLSAAENVEVASRHNEAEVRPILERHCLKCHSGEEPQGKSRLDQLPFSFVDTASSERWRKVLRRVAAGEMPPADSPRPSAEEVRKLTAWIEAGLQTAEAARRTEQGRVVLRRLNRIEYENTIHDLLRVQVRLQDELPQDGAADGFDNVGAALHTSAFLMEKYLDAAELALSEAIVNRSTAPKLVQTRYSLKTAHPIRSTSEKVYRFIDDTVVCFCSSAWHSVMVSSFYPQEGGRYRFRISAAAVQSGDKPVTFRVTSGKTRLNGKSGLVGYFDAPPGEPQVFEFVEYMEPRTTISILPYGLASAQAVNQVGAQAWEGPGLAIQFVEVEGPLYDNWPPDSHRQIFGDLEQKPAPIYNQSTRVEVVSSDQLADAERILRSFTRRAFRRTVTDEDVQPYVEVFQSNLETGSSFEQAIRAALKGVLISPEFIFLREEPGRLDDFALASRLSYFFWSTMPDEELLKAAEQKKLRHPEMLRQQVERMLKHPKAAAFTENFVGQWLGLREIDFTEPSHILYPEFDHMLKVSMIRETELFFDELLRDDLSLTNFVHSDFSMLNGRLAKHYGIEGIDGWEFKKTQLPPDSHRGGVLTMASVLKVTANGTTTSPILRGAWVLDRILGTPPSPPPDGISAIDPDIRGATTIREQLAKHRTVAMCASCHKRIDPPGFALESFDCIGGWRDHYRVTGSGESVIIDGRRMAYHKGKAVDPSDVMPDGAAFANVDEFKQLLLRDKDQLARALTTKLVTYATGAAPAAGDRPAIERIVASVREKDYGLRSLIHEIVQSELFQTK